MASQLLYSSLSDINLLVHTYINFYYPHKINQNNTKTTPMTT